MLSKRSSSAFPKIGQDGNGRVRIGAPPNSASKLIRVRNESRSEILRAATLPQLQTHVNAPFGQQLAETEMAVERYRPRILNADAEVRAW